MTKFNSFTTAISKMKMIGTGMIRRICMTAAIMLLAVPSVNASTTLLPNGKNCFATASNGPLAGGSVYMYYPSTNNFKQTWQDAAQSVANPQPIPLDSNGCALIYGVGSYRQVVYVGADNSTTLFYDQVTTDTSAFNSVFWAGLSGGTPNVLTIVDTGFNATDGSVVQFVALTTNTSASTLNPSSFGAISIVKDTTAGPVALTGGEIIAGNIISVVYYSTSNTFHLLNAVIASASGATAPLCGATGLKIVNDAGTPNSIIDVTANQAVMQTAAGLVINRGTVSVTINTSLGTAISTAGGMDGEALVASSWLYIWLIDNGSAPAALASLASGNGLSPNMPSGYTYKCRMGTMQVDSSKNLYKIQQLGPIGHWKGGTTAGEVPCKVANGVIGTYSATSPTLTATLVSGDGKCSPTTATAVNLSAVNSWKGGAGADLIAAPSSAYSGVNNGPTGSNGVVPPMWAPNNVTGTTSWISLESTSLYLASDGAGGAFFLSDWRDSVNAN